jgi:hypothetical protein
MPRGPTPPFCRCLSQRRAVSSACALLEFILSPAVSGSPLGKGCKRPGLRAAPGRGRSTSPSTAPARKLIDCTRDARARANTHTRTPPTTHEHANLTRPRTRRRINAHWWGGGMGRTGAARRKGTAGWGAATPNRRPQDSSPPVLCCTVCLEAQSVGTEGCLPTQPSPTATQATQVAARIWVQ